MAKAADRVAALGATRSLQICVGGPLLATAALPDLDSVHFVVLGHYRSWQGGARGVGG